MRTRIIKIYEVDVELFLSHSLPLGVHVLHMNINERIQIGALPFRHSLVVRIHRVDSIS